MRIADGTIYNNLSRNLNSDLVTYRKQQIITTAEKRLFVPSDDPNGIGNLTNYKSSQAGYAKYLDNLLNAETSLKTSETSLDRITDILTKMQSIAEDNATETSTKEERQIAADSVSQLIEESLEVLNTKIQGNYIFSGYKTNTQTYSDVGRVLEPYASLGNSYSGKVSVEGEYALATNKTFIVKISQAGEFGSARYQISDDDGATWNDSNVLSQSINIGESGLKLNFDSGAGFAEGDQFKIYVAEGNFQGDAGEIEMHSGRSTSVVTNISAANVTEKNGFFNMLHNLKIGLENDNTQLISSTLDGIKNMQTEVNRQIVKVGVYLNRVDIARSNIESLNTNLQENIADIEEPDMVEALSKLSRDETSLNSAITIMAKIFPNSLINYL